MAGIEPAFRTIRARLRNRIPTPCRRCGACGQNAVRRRSVRNRAHDLPDPQRMPTVECPGRIDRASCLEESSSATSRGGLTSPNRSKCGWQTVIVGELAAAATFGIARMDRLTYVMPSEIWIEQCEARGNSR